jgi:predicted O-methyltransferase YrrM
VIIKRKSLTEFLQNIYEFGSDYDSKNKIHSEQMLNITPDTGLFLSILIRASNAKSVLEIGTSDGYSTMWIADALSETGGKVTTLEVSEKKFTMANENFKKCGLSKHIDSRLVDARSYLKDVQKGTLDLVFLDAERPQYVSYWNDLDRVLRVNGLLVVDNALAPKPEDLIDFFRLVESSQRYLSQTLQLGKGEMIAVKTS